MKLHAQSCGLLLGLWSELLTAAPKWERLGLKHFVYIPWLPICSAHGVLYMCCGHYRKIMYLTASFSLIIPSFWRWSGSFSMLSSPMGNSWCVAQRMFFLMLALLVLFSMKVMRGASFNWICRHFYVIRLVQWAVQFCDHGSVLWVVRLWSLGALLLLPWHYVYTTVVNCVACYTLNVIRWNVRSLSSRNGILTNLCSWKALNLG